MNQNAVFWRMVYMTIAIAATLLLQQHPVLSFQSDIGIIYERSFQMDATHFWVTQTDLQTGAQEVTASTSLALLNYCNKAMFYCCLLCFLTFFSQRWRLVVALITAFVSGAYYLLITYYALKLADLHYVTISPNVYVILPAVVIQAMILLRTNIQKEWSSADESYD